ncbi:MAG: division/cell wall cluster transcriptional repressor MraZ [Coriobacteriales bacterium]|jgi:MraZ protein
MRFSGHAQHSVDDKGRVSLPAKQRKALPEEVVVVPGFGKALYVFSEEAFDAWVDSFFPEGYNPRSKGDRELRGRLFGSAENVAVDAAGRIKLSAEQREAVGIVKDVMISGNDDHLEIQDLAVYEQKQASLVSLDDLLED